MKKVIVLLVLLVSIVGIAMSQTFSFLSQEAPYNPSQTVPDPSLGSLEFFQPNLSDPNTYVFSPDALNLPSGVEYSYLWSFGDGRYSMEESPIHTYSSLIDAKSYQVVLYATPIYSLLDPPPAVYLPAGNLIEVAGTPGGNTFPAGSFMTDDSISISYNRLPSAFKEITFILTYKNISGNSQVSFPVFFQYNGHYFNYKDIVAPGGETAEGPFQISYNSEAPYTHQLVFMNDLSPLESNEERTIFIQMEATGNVISEAVIGPYGNFSEVVSAPELWVRAESSLGIINPPNQLTSDEASMYPVGSWDPNNKISSVPVINRDNLTFPKKVRYRINCENVGTAATSNVQIIDQVSPLLNFGSFNFVGDKESHSDLQIIENPNTRRITFDFSNLYLLGTNSPYNVALSDCQYWIDIEFEIDQGAFENSFGSSVAPCNYTAMLGSFGTSASIIFDSHAPITTNSANTEVYCEGLQSAIRIHTVSPNPTRGQLQVDYEVNSQINNLANVQAFLLNVNTGVMSPIASPAINISPGAHSFPLNISNQSPGLYKFVLILNGLNFESSTIVKI
ncbi:MAG: PKD domain-containing protein [Bacteroidia bacterium]